MPKSKTVFRMTKHRTVFRLTAKQLDLMTRAAACERLEVAGADLPCARGLYHRKAPLVSVSCHDGGADITDVDARPHFVVQLTDLGTTVLQHAKAS